MKINKLLCLSAVMLLITACGNKPTSSSEVSQSNSETTSQTTSTPEETRTNFEFSVPTNFEFEYSWQSTQTIDYKVTKIGDCYLAFDGMYYNFFKKLSNGKYSHFNKKTDTEWKYVSDKEEASFKRLALVGLYPISDGSFVKTGSGTQTIGRTDYDYKTFEDTKHDISYRYHEGEDLKLLIYSEDSTDVTTVKSINREVSEFPIDVPETK